MCNLSGWLSNFLKIISKFTSLPQYLYVQASYNRKQFSLNTARIRSSIRPQQSIYGSISLITNCRQMYASWIDHFEPYLRLALFLFLFVEFLGPTSFTASSQNPMLEFLVSALLQILLTRSDAHWLGGPAFIEPQTEFPRLVCRLECC